MKNKFLIPILCVSAFAVSLASSIVGTSVSKHALLGEGDDFYAVTLNGDNAVEATNVAQNYHAAVKTRSVEWSYESAKAEAGYHVVLGAGGTIKNELEINSILSISVSYVGSGLSLYGYNDSAASWLKVVEFTDVVTQFEVLHYSQLSFKNDSAADVKVESIQIKYSKTCDVYGGLYLSGLIYDVGQNDIEGATVSVYSLLNGVATLAGETYSAADGSYSFAGLFLPTSAYRLTVEKAGFDSQQFDLTEETSVKNVELVRSLKDYGSFGISGLSRIYMTRDASAYRFRIVIPTASFAHNDDTFSIWLNFDGLTSPADRAGAHVLEFKTTPTGWYGIYDYVSNAFLGAWWGTSLNVTQTVVGENTVIDAFITYAFINGDGGFCTGYPVVGANTKVGFSFSEYDAADEAVFGGYSLTTGWFADPANPQTYIFIGLDGITSVLLGGAYTANEDGALPL